MKRRLYHLLMIITFFSCSGEKAKVLIVNSYHPGYPSSDEALGGITEWLPSEQFDKEVFYMDTKNQPAERFEEIGTEVFARVEGYRPDYIIAMDDNAVKYLVVPYLKEISVPVVFCGVNWTAEPYNLPGDKVTGVLEILPLQAALDTMLAYYPKAKTITIITENSTSARKDQKIISGIFSKRLTNVSYSYCNDFSEWHDQILLASDSTDLVYFPTNGGIRDWNGSKAISILKNIKAPIFTCDDFMMPYATYGLTKVAREQGELAAKYVLELAKGTLVADLPVIKNQRFQPHINNTWAHKINFHEH